MKPTRILQWDINKVTRALRIDVRSVRESFTDGRRIAFLIERRIAFEEGLALAAKPGAAFDLVDSLGARWEVRNIGRSGIYFCPSCMVGSGRLFDDRGFLAKLAGVAGYIVTDIELFPHVPYWILSRSVIQAWWSANSLGTTTRISREKALRLINLLPEAA